MYSAERGTREAIGSTRKQWHAAAEERTFHEMRRILEDKRLQITTENPLDIRFT